jgi:hypothetical protein
VRRESRRVLVLWVLTLVLSLLAAGWLRHVWRRPTPEERAREEAERIKEKVRELTH